ncbi:MAG: DUF1636 domain-containing protein, partial [Pseudomonadota bacterium]
EDLRDQPWAVNAAHHDTRKDVTLSICLRCRDGREDAEDCDRGGSRLADAVLLAGIAEHGVAVRGVHCLSQCKRACTVAVSGPDRFTYVFGDLDPSRDAAAVVAVVGLYAESADGFMAREARPRPLQAGVLGRVPPLGWRGDAVETVDLIPNPVSSETQR